MSESRRETNGKGKGRSRGKDRERGWWRPVVGSKQRGIACIEERVRKSIELGNTRSLKLDVSRARRYLTRATAL